MGLPLQRQPLLLSRGQLTDNNVLLKIGLTQLTVVAWAMPTESHAPKDASVVWPAMVRLAINLQVHIDGFEVLPDSLEPVFL